MITLITKKTGAGHFKVIVNKDYDFAGEFNTTDMGLIDDIWELNNNGSENELYNYDDFETLKNDCLSMIDLPF